MRFLLLFFLLIPSISQAGTVLNKEFLIDKCDQVEKMFIVSDKEQNENQLMIMCKTNSAKESEISIYIIKLSESTGIKSVENKK